MKKERIKLFIRDGQFPFIPPFTEASSWLNTTLDLTKTFEYLENNTELSLYKIDRKTIKSGSIDGFTQKTAEKIEYNLHLLRDHYQLDLSTPYNINFNTVKPGSNGIKWLVSLDNIFRGLRIHHQVLTTDNTIKYLNHRRRVENVLLYLTHKINRKNTAIEKRDLLIKLIKKTYNKHTQLERSNIDEYASVLSEAIIERKFHSNEKYAIFLKHNISLKVDFYYSLLAHFMKDILEIRSLLRLPPKIEEQLIDQGCLGKLYPERVGMEILMPTQKLFSFFRSAYTTNNIPLSYKNMSRHINNPNPSRSRISNNHPTQEVSEIIKATKLKQLKSWRSGVTPESDHLAEFLESLSGEQYSAFLPFFLCRITSMWNKFYAQEAASLKNEIERHKNLEKYIDEEWLLSTFSTYTKYWQKNAQANTA